MAEVVDEAKNLTICPKFAAKDAKIKFMKFHTKLNLIKGSQLKVAPFEVEYVDRKPGVSNLKLIRDHIVRYSLCQALDVDQLGETTKARVLIRGSHGHLLNEYGRKLSIYDHINNIRPQTRNSARRIVRYHNYLQDSHYCCCPQFESLCEHETQFNPEVVILNHIESELHPNLIIKLLKEGRTIVIITHLFDPLVSEGCYQEGRWKFCTWARRSGLIFFSNDNGNNYLHPEFFNYMNYTSSYSGQNFNITKTMEINYGDFKHVGLIIQSISRKSNDLDYSDFKIKMEFEELMKFRRVNGFRNSQAVVMSKEATLTDTLPIISKDGGIAIMEVPKETKELSLIKTINGTVHFSKFKRDDLSLWQTIISSKDPLYNNSLIADYFSVNCFKPKDVSLKLKLDDYNRLVSELLIAGVNETTIFWQVSEQLKGTFKWADDPTTPLLAIKSAILDVARIKSGIQGLMQSGANLTYQNVSSAKPPNYGLIEKLSNSIRPTGTVDTDKLLYGAQEPNFKFNNELPKIKSTKSRYLKAMKSNSNQCTLICLYFMLLEVLDITNDIPEECDSNMEETIIEISKQLDEEDQKIIAIISKGTQLQPHQFLSYMQQLFEELSYHYFISKDFQDYHEGSTPGVIITPNHVQLSYQEEESIFLSD